MTLQDDTSRFWDYDGWENMPSAPEVDRLLDARIDAYADVLLTVGKNDPQASYVAHERLRFAKLAHLKGEAKLLAECIQHGLPKMAIDA